MFIERSSLETRMSSKGRKLIARVDTKCSRKKKDRLLDNMCCMVDVKRDEYVVEKDSIICYQRLMRGSIVYVCLIINFFTMGKIKKSNVNSM